MPSVSPKQARFMAAAAHSKKFADKVGMDQEVAREFNQADQRRAAEKHGYLKQPKTRGGL